MGSFSNQNIVIYDWLSFTSKNHTPEDFIAALGLTAAPWTKTRGSRGYQYRKYFSSISIHYGRDDGSIWCEMSGQGCRTFESLSSVSWESLFSWIHAQELKITRLDVAYDDHTGILPLERITFDTQLGMWISRMSSWSVTMSNKGTTIGIGSQQSEVYIRIYDKAAERGKAGEHWVRVEIQMRDDRALQFSKIGLPIGEAFTGVLLNYLRYIEPSEDSNKWRWPLTDYWDDLVADASKISIFQAPGMEYNEEQCKHYVVEQAGNAIAALIDMYGIEEFESMIDNRKARPNPKYDMLVKQHEMAKREFRFQELVDKVRRFGGDIT